MAHDWNIRPRGSVCETCQHPFEDGETCVSSIRQERDDSGAPVLVRSDRCRACAKAAPEDYKDLIVRVAGYSSYFTVLTPRVQDEIIARTDHNL